MIPRSPAYNYPCQEPGSSSPKFGSHQASQPCPTATRGLGPHPRDRQTLIDQIINNCKRAQSPLLQRGSSNKSRSGFGRGSGVDEKEKENARAVQSPVAADKLAMHRKYLNDSRKSRHQIGQEKVKILGPVSTNTVNKLICLQQCQEYFTKGSPKAVHCSPAYKFNTVSQSSYQKARESVNSNKAAMLSSGKDSSSEIKMRGRIQQQRQAHIEHCKTEERKIRLFYVELENKLCEMRNKELKKLAQFQSQKLKQYEDCMRTISGSRQDWDLQKCQQKLHLLQNYPTLRVNETVKPEIQGCLTQNQSGVYFSFDQMPADAGGF